MNICGLPPGSRGLLPAPSPLRTGHETFTSSGSSIGKASCDTRQLELPSRYTVVYGILFQARTVVSNIAVTIIHTNTVVPFKSFHVIQRHAGSLHTFVVGQILNPYQIHYKSAFAFSGLLYPHPHRPTLRFAVLPGKEKYGLTKFHFQYTMG